CNDKQNEAQDQDCEWNDCRFEVQDTVSFLTSDARPVTAKISQLLLTPEACRRPAPTRKPSTSVRQLAARKTFRRPRHAHALPSQRNRYQSSQSTASPLL